MSSQVVLDKKALIVSETDKRGVIRYVNDDFCIYSGYKEEELIGKSHNILRHPDMPKDAFKNLWENVKSGKSWKGFVKNKTKDGRYYWVLATVFPITTFAGDGFLSVRTKANSEEIAKYEELYSKMREKE